MTPSAGRDSAAGDVVAERLADYRRVREQIERDILPLATSVDGLSFEFQASLHDLAVRRGGYVMLEADGTVGLGQITDVRVDSVEAAGQGISGAASNVLIRLARGSGTMLDTSGQPFHDASVRPAGTVEVGAWFARTRPVRAGLTIGELLLAPGVPATLDSGGLGRHTFMCGQSGSGKTYSLGLVLERVLAETTPARGGPRPELRLRRARPDPGATPIRSSQPGTPACRTRSPSGGTTRLRTIRCDCASRTWTRSYRRPSWASTPFGTVRSTRSWLTCCASASRASRWSRTSNSC